MNANQTPDIVPTQNEGWGFFGTVMMNTGKDASYATDVWNDVSCEIMMTFGLTGKQTQEYLDSRHGRHLADAMTDGDEIKGEFPKWLKKSITLHFNG